MYVHLHWGRNKRKLQLYWKIHSETNHADGQCNPWLSDDILWSHNSILAEFIFPPTVYFIFCTFLEFPLSVSWHSSLNVVQWVGVAGDKRFEMMKNGSLTVRLAPLSALKVADIPHPTTTETGEAPVIDILIRCLFTSTPAQACTVVASQAQTYYFLFVLP